MRFVDDLWLLTIGKAIFDNRTGHFLGCTMLDMSVADMAELLEVIQVNGTEEFVLVHWDDGTVVYSSQWNSTDANDYIHDYADLGFHDAFYRIKSLVDVNEPWNASEVGEILHENMYAKDGKLGAAFPIPEPPQKYCPLYRPYFMVIKSVVGDIYGLIDEMESSIDEDITTLFWVTLMIGLFGLIIVLLVSWTVAILLTRPLNWMMTVARGIVRHSSDQSDESIYGNENEGPFIRCTPKTEITLLVSEFQSIIQRFSRDCPASVASPDVHNVFNCVSWNEDFGMTYLEQLFDSPNEAYCENHALLKRHSSSLTATSHHSMPSTIDQDSFCGDCIDSGEMVVVVSSSAASQPPDVRSVEKQPSLPSAQQSLTNVSAMLTMIDGSIPRDSEDEETMLVQNEIPEKPRHLLSCSDSTRVNKGQIISALADDDGVVSFDVELHESLGNNKISVRLYFGGLLCSL